MKRFSMVVLITALLSCIIVVALEIAIYRTPNQLKYKDWYMTENADGIKVLLLGNSLFANSFDPHELGDSVFDGATDARSLYYDKMILKKYAPRMGSLKVVMIPLIVSLYSEPSTSLFFSYPYARYMDLPIGHNPFQYFALFSGHLVFHSLEPISISSHVEQVKDYDHDRNMDSVGYSPLFHTWNGYLRNVYIPTYEEGVSNREAFIQHIGEMATYCNSHGIRFICILPPAADVYINDVDSRLYDTLYSVMDYLSKAYHVEYKFYHDDPEFRSDSLYADELHLNYWGARKFAKRVKQDFGL